MIIQVRTTTTTDKEIDFPYVTFYEYINTYYYNNAENSCIVVNERAVEIYNTNLGLDHPEAKKEDCFKLMDKTILRITEALNK